MGASQNRNLLFICHEATRTGAPIMLLHILRWLKENTSYNISIVVARGGELETEIDRWGTTFHMDRSHFYPQSMPARILRAARRSSWAHRQLAKETRRFVARAAPALIYANSTASASTVRLLAPTVPVVAHAHELDLILETEIDPTDWQSLNRITQTFIACSGAVRNMLVRKGVDAAHIETVHEFIPVAAVQPQRTRTQVLRDLNLPDDVALVVGGGTIEWRKGTDLFVQIARYICRRELDTPVHFVWLGGAGAREFAQLRHDILLSDLDEHIHLLGSVRNPADYFAAADLLALPSREDPYPLVGLEAAAVRKPIVCFEAAGGMPEFVEEDCGFVVPYLDVTAFAERILCLIASPDLRARMGEAAHDKVMKRHDIGVAAPRILNLIEKAVAEGDSSQ